MSSDLEKNIRIAVQSAMMTSPHVIDIARLEESARERLTERAITCIIALRVARDSDDETGEFDDTLLDAIIGIDCASIAQGLATGPGGGWKFRERVLEIDRGPEFMAAETATAIGLATPESRARFRMACALAVVTREDAYDGLDGQPMAAAIGMLPVMAGRKMATAGKRIGDLGDPELFTQVLSAHDAVIGEIVTSLARRGDRKIH